MDEKKKGVKDTVEKMRQMAQKGYDSKQKGRNMIIPQMGKKVRADKNKLSPQAKAKNKVRTAILKKKAKAKAKAKGKAKEEAELEVVAEPQELGPPDNPS